MNLKTFLASKPARIITYLLAFIGLGWLASIVFIKPAQYADICEANGANCKMVEAEFSYDSMDGMFAITRLQPEGSVAITYNSTECWVRPEGSACEDSAGGKNMTGSERVIIPLALTLDRWRWDSSNK